MFHKMVYPGNPRPAVSGINGFTPTARRAGTRELRRLRLVVIGGTSRGCILMAIKREPKPPHFPTSMALQLQELSEARREIIRPVLESPREFVLLNIRDMARRLETGPATVVRIVRALGFDTYKD